MDVACISEAAIRAASDSSIATAPATATLDVMSSRLLKTIFSALAIGGAIAVGAWYLEQGRPAEPSAEPSTQGPRIGVAQPEERLDGEAPLHFAVSGRAVNADGEAVTGASVKVRLIGDGIEPGNENIHAETDSSGKFHAEFVDRPGASFERVEVPHPSFGSAIRPLTAITATGHLDVGDMILLP